MKIKLLSLLALALIVSVSGCKKKEEEETPPPATTSTNADYAGTWNANETCTSAWTYQMTAAASGSNGLTFTNFHKGTFSSGFTITATVSDKTLTIPSQSASSTAQGGPYTFVGSGTFTPPSTLAITYTMTGMGCTANCSK